MLVLLTAAPRPLAAMGTVSSATDSNISTILMLQSHIRCALQLRLLEAATSLILNEESSIDGEFCGSHGDDENQGVGTWRGGGH